MGPRHHQGSAFTGVLWLACCSPAVGACGSGTTPSARDQVGRPDASTDAPVDARSAAEDTSPESHRYDADREAGPACATPDAGATTAASLPQGHKTLTAGLLDKGSEGPYHAGQPYPVTDPASDTVLTAKVPAMSGLVINQVWSQLEPTEGTFDFTVLDQSLAAFDAYNAAHPCAPLSARLRVFGAYAAPAWAKTLDGPAISTMDSDKPATVAEWWGPMYRSAWAGLQAALSARYDGNKVLLDVAVSSCAASTAEPMVIDTDTLQAAKAVGYTTMAEQTCLVGAFADYAGWKKTAIYFPLNPVAGDATIAPDILSRCSASASSGGPVCVLANNALDQGVDESGNLATVYTGIGMAWQASPDATFVGFQMNGPTTTTWCAAMQVAVKYHARSVELWPNGYDSVEETTLAGWAGALRAGVGPMCP